MGKVGILCPRCRKFISSDEPTCPYCGLIRPGAQRILRDRLSFLFSADPVKSIIAVNAVLFVLSLLINPTSQGLGLNPLTLLSPSDHSLLVMGATGTMPINGYGSWWTLVSASYLHGGILHIFFNMMALMQLGPFVLSAYGLSRFILLYVLTGVGGIFHLLPGGYSLYHWGLGQHLRPDRGHSLLRKEPGRVFRRCHLPAGHGLDHWADPFRADDSWDQQLGPRRRAPFWSTDWISGGV